MSHPRPAVALAFSVLLALVIAQPALAATAAVQPSGTFNVSLSFSPSNVQVNSQLTGSYSISSPNAPYTISMSQAPPGCGPQPNPFTTSNASGSWTCHPTATGTFNVQVSVTDSLGNTGAAQFTVTVSGGSGSGTGNNTGGINLSFLQDLLPVVLITAVLFLGSVVAIAVSAVALAILVPRRLKQIRKVLEGVPLKKAKGETKAKDETSAAPSTPPPPKEQPPGEEL